MLKGHPIHGLSAAVAVFTSFVIASTPVLAAEPPPEIDSGMELVSAGHSPYPKVAVRDGLEGWVLVSLTVNPDGTVKDAEVAKSDPEGVFEEAAITRAKSFVFKPRMENGRGIEVEDVQWVINYALTP